MGSCARGLRARDQSHTIRQPTGAVVRHLLAVLSGLAMLLCAAAVHALDPNVGMNQFRHTRWTAEDGVPLGIYALAQTPDGFLWTGSDSGLHRFDGVRFEVVPARANGARVGEPVSALLTARNGDLWIGYQSGRIALLRDGTLIDRSPAASDRWVYRFLEDRSGAVWTITGNSNHPFMRYAAGRWESIGAQWGITAPSAWGIAESRDGRVWVSDGARTLVLAPGERRFRNVGIAGTRGDGYNEGLATDRSGRVWQSSGVEGTRRLPSVPLARPDVPPFATVPAASATHSYRTFLFDRDGSIWGVTYSAGMFRIATPDALYRGGRPVEETFTANDGLSSDRALSILEDREGNLWVGTSAGLDRFTPANVRPATDIPAYSRFGYIVMGARDGTVYAADSDSLYGISPKGITTRLLDGLNNPQALCEDAMGVVWFATSDAFFRGVGQRFERIPTDKRRNFLDCVATPDGRLWFSRTRGGITRYENGIWTDSLPDGPDGPLKVTTLIAYRNGLLAHVRSRGLVYMELPDTRVVWKKDDIPGGEITALQPMGNDVLLASVGGMARLRDGKITPLGRDAPWLQGVVGIADDRLGYTWMLSRAGIARVSRDALARAFDDPDAPLHAQLFDFDDGLKAPAVTGYSRNSAVLGGDGVLRFLTTDAIVQVQPARLARNRMPPPVSITGLAFGSQRLRDPASATLPAGASRIEIDYTALSLTVPRRVRFRYQLLGVDDDWVEAGNRRQAFYTNLAPGDYRFRVVAANNDGVWNPQGASLDFTVPPTFIQSMWFKALVVAALALVLWMLYALRLRYATARLRDRFDAQMAERNRIARDLHDTLLQGMQGMLLSFQALASKLPQDATLRQQMERVLDRTQDTIREGRDRIHQLRDPEASTMDLAESLGRHAQELAAEHQLVCDITVPLPPRPLQPIVYEELRQIGREAISNACVHSSGTRVDIRLTYGDAGVVLTVQDDGVGIADDRMGVERHWGLKGMRERALLIGATLSITGRPGGGTEVKVGIDADAAYPRH